MFQTEIKNDKVYSLLIEAAQTAEPIQRNRHSAAIVYKKRILTIGKNSRRSHPMQKLFGGEDRICVHAEVDAIIRCINLFGTETLKRSSIYCLRLTKADKVAISKPCASCRKAIDAFSIKKVFWTE